MSEPQLALPRERWIRADLAPWRLSRADLVILLALIVGVALCLGSGTGFETNWVLWGYLNYFGLSALYLFAAVRLTNLVRERWQPKSSSGRRLLATLGGRADATDFFRADLEFLRGLIVMLLTLTVYTNVKVRIPILNETVGDDLFQALDDLLFGERFATRIEAWTSIHPQISWFLNRVYSHGYIWMIALIFWFWVRADVWRMRWLFASFSVLYLTSIFITAIYPSYGPFFLDWPRFEWARETQSGQVQAWLVRIFLNSTTAVEQGAQLRVGAFQGIAAFPSLHVGHMVLIAVIGWSTARAFAVLMIAVAMVTTVATIAFGWHYLVDAFAGSLLAVVIPWQVGRLVPPLPSDVTGD